MARTVTISDTILQPDGTPEVGTITAQLTSSSTLLKDTISNSIVDREPAPDTLDSTGAFTLTLVAPGDLVDAISGVAPTSCYYLLTLPDGSTIVSTAFPYTATTLTLADIDANTTEGVTYPTAAVTFSIGRPDQQGPVTPVSVTAWLSTDASYGTTVTFLAADLWTTTIPATGSGTLSLPPNPDLSPNGTFYWIVLGNGSTYAIQVPTGGGNFLDLLINPFVGGNLTTAAQLTYRGTWAIGTAYNVNDLATLAGSTYACTVANTGSMPPSADWQLFVGAPLYAVDALYAAANFT